MDPTTATSLVPAYRLGLCLGSKNPSLLGLDARYYKSNGLLAAEINRLGYLDPRAKLHSHEPQMIIIIRDSGD